jgi:large repetitive protein
VVRRAIQLGVLAAAVAGCGAEPYQVEPVVDAPAPGSSADPFVDLDTLVVSVAEEGQPDDLVSASFARGTPVSLAGVPYQPDLVVHMTGQVAGAEVAYGRTCAFDLEEGQPPPAPHLYFARNVRWAASAGVGSPTRTGGFAWTASDGSGAFLGGADAAGAGLTTVDRFDPRTGAYQTLADPLLARTGPAEAPLGDGRLVVLGGTDPIGGAPVDMVELLDPVASAGRQEQALVDARASRTGAAAVTQSDGRVAFIGGRDATGVLVTSVLEVRAEAGSVAVREVHASMSVPREGATLTRLGDDVGAPVLVVGGVDDGGAPVALAELYKPLQEGFADPALFTPTLTEPRHLQAAVRTPDGGVLVVGGVDGAGNPISDLELWSYDQGFHVVGTLPPTAGVVDFSLTPLPDGRFLLAGGRTAPGGPALDTAFILRLDTVSGSIDVAAAQDHLQVARAGHQAVLLCDGTVLLVGGADTTFAERFDPPSNGRR